MMAVSTKRLHQEKQVIHQEQKNNLRILVGAIGLIVILLALTTLGRVISDASLFPVKGVKIQGELRYVKRDAVIDLVATHAAGSFFTLDLNQIQFSIQELAWVRQAAVRRVWPNSLVLELLEREPVARWNKNQLIGTDGVMFSPPQLGQASHDRDAWVKYFDRLPALSGSPRRYQTVSAMHREFSLLFKRLNLQVTSLNENARRSVDLTLSNGLKLRLGRRDHQERLQRFISIYQRVIEPKIQGLKYVDLRYTNGLSIGYKKPLDNRSH